MKVRPRPASRRWSARPAPLLALSLAASPALLAGAALPLAACSHDSDERLGLEEKDPHAFNPKDLADDGELERAVTLSSSEVAKKLGAHRLTQKTSYQLAAADPEKPENARKEAFDETWKLEVSDKGDAYLDHENSRGYGFERYVVGDSVYVRPMYGHFLRRPPEAHEVENARDEQENVLASYLRVLGRFAERKDGGAVTMLGRPAHKVLLKLDGSPARFRDKEPAQKWRKGMKVSALTGEVVVDDASGAPLHATLAATYTAPRPDLGEDAPRGSETAPKEVRVTLAYQADAELGVAAIAPPADFTTEAQRVRPLVDKQLLLDGLIPPPPSATNGSR